MSSLANKKRGKFRARGKLCAPYSDPRSVYTGDDFPILDVIKLKSIQITNLRYPTGLVGQTFEV